MPRTILRYVLARTFFLMSLAALLPWAPAARAHHGWSGYHTTLEKRSGTVVSHEYQYPHASLSMTIDGKAVSIVLAPPSRMERRGLLAESIKPGDTVEVQGYFHRGGETELRAERIVVKGQTYELR